jgi:hypothetical protein
MPDRQADRQAGAGKQKKDPLPLESSIFQINSCMEAALLADAKSPEMAEVQHAFVTLRRQGDTDLLLKCYEGSNFPMFHDQEVVVQRAPGPKDNLWANLDTSYKMHKALHALCFLIT